MTASGGFIPRGGGGAGSQREATRVFGVELTPGVGGILIGVLGVVAAGYWTLTYTMPKFDELNQLNSQLETLRQEVATQEASLKKVDQIKAQIEQAKQQNETILKLFSKPETVNTTLLLDLNRKVLMASGVELIRFVPNPAGSGIVTDGSLGPELNGKLKRQFFDVAVKGTYDRTLNAIRNLERLETLTIVQNVNIAPGSEKNTEDLNTSFQLVALVPLTPEELAAEAAKAAAAAQKPAQ